MKTIVTTVKIVTKNTAIIVQTKHKMLLLTILLLLMATETQGLIRQSYGTNQIINGDFNANPVLSTVIFYWNIPGWSCQKFCQLHNCSSLGVYYPDTNCTGQVLDLNSARNNQVVTQILVLNEQQYLLEFFYYYSSYTNNKTLFIYFNGQLLFQSSPTTSSFSSLPFSQYILANSGVNNLTFTMVGSTSNSYGFKIGDVTLRQVFRESESNEVVLNSIIVGALNSTVTAGMVSFPNSRVLFQSLTGFLGCLDRLQFYYYHKRYYSANAQAFLSAINELLSQKGSFIEKNLNDEFGVITTAENMLGQQTNFKINYTDPEFLVKSSQGFGFFINNGSVIIYNIPMTLFVMLIATIILVFIKRAKHIQTISQFALFGIFLSTLCEGNIQQYTFYTFAEFKTFFCFNFYNKIQNFALLVFFFIVLFTSAGSVFWFKYHYKKKAKLLSQDCKHNLIGLFTCCLDNGIICLVFGIIHQMLLNFPNAQLITFFFIELLWFSTRVHLFRKKVYLKKTLTIFGFVESVLRMLFQMFCFIYSNFQAFSTLLNDELFPYLIYCFLANWALQILTSIIFVIIQIIQHFKCKSKNQITALRNSLNAKKVNFVIQRRQKKNGVKKEKLEQGKQIKEKGNLQYKKVELKVKQSALPNKRKIKPRKAGVVINPNALKYVIVKK